ncbi:hypothetical protein M569_14057 [Genlisea aurea]|uniref:non-specific serine/threonine protein kinase n=1 Tax=Genlisea aurea TaxID=192259 RepID=S8C216_9LAMI|nr:hypothetical protein M569_14057 [Genlisea aurea]
MTHEISVSTSPSVDFSTTVSGSENTSSDSSDGAVAGIKKADEAGKCSLSSLSYSDGVVEEGGRSLYSSKPHQGNDFRWEAIRGVICRDGELNVGHFRLVKKLGFGDIGTVYLAELRGVRCLFALKVMDKEGLVSRKKMTRAETEKDILASLDHPFLPTLYSHFETDKFYCLLMEFCSGGDLHFLRQRQPGRRFSEKAARFYASEVLLSLEYLHMMGVIYRDLKPENVLVREDGHIMLSDFDLSLKCHVNPTLISSSSRKTNCKNPCVEPSCFRPPFLAVRPDGSNPKQPELIAEPTGARSMSFVGTHEYLAPEIIRGDGHGSAVDWWTFGIFLYELVYGKTPFKGDCNRETLFNVVGKNLKFPEGSNPVGFAAKDLIRGLLVKEPHKRLGFKRGANEIKRHPFFQTVNWPLIRSAQPPVIPQPFDPAADFKDPLDCATESSRKSSASFFEFEFF